MSKKIERKDRHFKFETLQLHVGQESPDPVTDARAVPIYQTSSYVFRNCDHAAARFGLADAGNIYGRLTNPTEDVFEKRIAALEGGSAALAVASGAAAITYTIENLAQQGDHIVAAKNIYGGTTNLLEHTLPAYGITTTFVDVFNLEEVENAIQENTKAVYIETLGNPNSDVVDIEALTKIAHKHKIPLVVDNTFATPYCAAVFFTVSSAGASLNGILMIKVEPTPSLLLTSIVPPIFSIRPFTIAIPSPIPCCVLLASSLSCENGSNICSWYSLLIPMPVSVMVHSYVVIPSTASV